MGKQWKQWQILFSWTSKPLLIVTAAMKLKYLLLRRKKSFPYSSGGKESTCNAGDPSLIPGSGRSSGERIGYPLQYSWASLVAQMVNNPPTMQETWVRSLEDSSGGGHGNPLQYSCLENPHGQRSLVGYSPWGRKESDTTKQLSPAQHRHSLVLLENCWDSHSSLTKR